MATNETLRIDLLLAAGAVRAAYRHTDDGALYELGIRLKGHAEALAAHAPVAADGLRALADRFLDRFPGADDPRTPPWCRVCDEPIEHHGDGDGSTHKSDCPVKALFALTGPVNAAHGASEDYELALEDCSAAMTAKEARGASEGLLRELRADGWMVASHNDYMQDGERFTFWLLTKGDRFIKGEGRTDAEALAALAEPATKEGK